VDAKRFDALTRRAVGTSRRRILTGLAGGFIGGLGLLREQPGAAQDYDKRGQTSTTNAGCNAPCRPCDIDDPSGVGRCVYACDSKVQVCDAGQTGPLCVDAAGNRLTKGCCVSR
jgi:hypothetical protein